MYASRQAISVTTDASGNAVAYSDRVSGRVLGIHYIKDTFANGVDFTITAEATGEVLWSQLDVNATASVYPRAGVHSTAGVAALYAAGGTAVTEAIILAQDRVKISIAQGGNTLHGTFHVVIG